MPRPFWALFAATLVNRSASFVGPFLVLYLSQRGLDVQTVGLVSASAGHHGEATLRRTCLVVGLVLAVAQAALAPALRRRQYA